MKRPSYFGNTRRRYGIGILRGCRVCLLFKPVSEFNSVGRGYLNSYCRECSQASGKRRYIRDRDAVLANQKLQRWLLKLEMIAAYGGKCECCGEVRAEFLSLDHVGGGGTKDRRDSGGTAGICRRLKRLGWPRDGFRLLCFNCNLSIGFLGYCPHERERQP
jgi:hypothetical protein